MELESKNENLMIQNEQFKNENSGKLADAEGSQRILDAAKEENEKLRGQIGPLKKQIKDLLVSSIPSQQYRETEQNHLKIIQSLQNGFNIF